MALLIHFGQWIVSLGLTVAFRSNPLFSRDDSTPGRRSLFPRG